MRKCCVIGEREVTRQRAVRSVGAGWAKIVGDLVDKLYDLGWDGTLLDVKEKFGGLRFYTGYISDEMNDLINKAEHESLKTCDVCGEAGEPVEINFWIRTVCKKDAEAKAKND